MSKEHFVHDAGKGSRLRTVDKQKFDEGWDRIFGRTPEGESLLQRPLVIEPPIVETIYICFKCKTVNNPDDYICKNCGEELWK